jgi:hypothetical protein
MVSMFHAESGIINVNALQAAFAIDTNPDLANTQNPTDEHLYQ